MALGDWRGGTTADVVAVRLPPRQTFSNPAARSRPRIRGHTGGPEAQRHPITLRYIGTDGLARSTHRPRADCDLVGRLPHTSGDRARRGMASQSGICSRLHVGPGGAVHPDVAVNSESLWTLGRTGNRCWRSGTVVDGYAGNTVDRCVPDGLVAASRRTPGGRRITAEP